MRLSERAWLTQSLIRLRLLERQETAQRKAVQHPSSPGATLSHLKALLETTSDCILFLDPAGRALYLNQQAARAFSQGKPLMGQSLGDVVSEDPSSSDFLARVEHATASRQPATFETFLRLPQSWFEVQAIPVEGGTALILRNINERRQAADTLRDTNQKLATVFGQTAVGILHRDLDNRVLMVNERFCEMVGRSSEELNGLPLQDLIHPDHIDACIAAKQMQQESGAPLCKETRYLRPDGSSVWCAINLSFVRDASGEIASVIVVAEDITARKEAEDKVRAGQELLKVVIDSVQDLIFVKDRDGRYVLTNQKLVDEFGPLEGIRDRDRFPDHIAETYETSDQRILETGEMVSVRDLMPVRGGPRSFHTVKVPWKQDGKIAGVIGVSRDLSEHLKSEAALRESQRQLATLIDNLPGIVYQCSLLPPWEFTFMSEGAERLTGYPASDFTTGGLVWKNVVHPDDYATLCTAINEAVEGGHAFACTYRIITRSGETRWVQERGQCIRDNAGQPIFLEGTVDDISAQKQAEEHLRWGAHHDSLTRLPNRMLFQERLDEALKRSAETGRKVALLLLDADRLKEVNDTLGHDAGDMLLRTMASRLTLAVRSTDTVARNGGDEFAVVMPDLDPDQDLEDLVAPIVERLQEPFTHAGHTLECRASIGASLWPDHARRADDLLKQADVALYTAKTTGRGKLMVFENTMRAEAQRKSQMRSSAREAIDARLIEPYYQPKIDFSTGRIAGFEALLRWHHPKAGVQPPAGIQAAFEEPRLAVAIGQQMHDLVLRDMRRWLDAGLDFGHVAVNASAAEFRGADFAEQVLSRLHAARIPTRLLEIEVTETVFLGRGAEHVETALKTLSAAGVKIALDDFGTGYASLSHLKQFPVDSIKIDRSFVHDLADNPDDTAILLAVLNLGQNLGIDTIAEGVETMVQADFLQRHGCNFGQGYLFGKAGPRSEVPTLLHSWGLFRAGEEPLAPPIAAQ